MQAEQQGKTAAVAEVPLWFESGWPKPERSSIAVISCPEAIRHSRLCETRGWSEEKIAAVDSWQWKAKDKEASADMLIHNAGTLENLNTETDRFLMELKARRSRMLASRISHWKSSGAYNPSARRRETGSGCRFIKKDVFFRITGFVFSLELRVCSLKNSLAGSAHHVKKIRDVVQ